ncbi:hypothetical protein BDV12DRAFT_203344 [Aspergillus spectabilis]
MGEYALRAFFHDYCIVPIDSSVSRGFLSGLESRDHRLGLDSDVAKACKAVGFASHGIKLSRPFLTRVAEELYQELLKSLAREIKDSNRTKKQDATVVAILLGLYEMTMAKDTNPGHHSAHAGGLTALLQIPNTPFALLEAVGSGGYSLTYTSGIFSTPRSTHRGKDLDDLLLRLQPFYDVSEMIIIDQVTLLGLDKLQNLQTEAIALKNDIDEWQQAQPNHFRPTKIGRIVPNTAHSGPQIGYWPGRIDVYPDFYVAATWNVSRVARCFLIYLISRLSDALGENSDLLNTLEEASSQVEDIVASIPYHLSDDIQVFIQHADKRAMIEPGRTAGGLLLMHPLYVISKLPIIAREMQDYILDCLLWIGYHMGIGQATVLAENPNMETDYITSGCMIIWAGLLL